MIIVLLKYLKKIKSLGFVFIGLGTILLISIIFGLIFPGASSGNPIVLKNIYYKFFVGVLITPIIETAISQAIPFYLVNTYIKTKKKRYIFIFISPVLFIHTFNLGYIGASYLIGIILAFFYYVAHFRKENSILLISMIHCMNNLIAFSTFYLP